MTAKARRHDGPMSLAVNVDHVATLRNARGGSIPIRWGRRKSALEAGADDITVHLREDRRHIHDQDLTAARGRHRSTWSGGDRGDGRHRLPAAPARVLPGARKRQEATTEGGLDAPAGPAGRGVARLGAAGIQVSLFVDPIRARSRRRPGSARRRSSCTPAPMPMRGGRASDSCWRVCVGVAENGRGSALNAMPGTG